MVAFCMPKEPNECRACNEHLTPSEWWNDLALRLRKAEGIMTEQNTQTTIQAARTFLRASEHASRVSRLLLPYESAIPLKRRGDSGGEG